jgi:hypothetical protein
VSDDLERVKTALSRRYLGKAGIHAFGVRPSANAISVYMAPGSREQYKQLLDELKKEAQPFEVLFTEEEPPNLAK